MSRSHNIVGCEAVEDHRRPAVFSPAHGSIVELRRPARFRGLYVLFAAVGLWLGLAALAALITRS